MSDFTVQELMAEAHRLSKELSDVTERTYEIASELANATVEFEAADARAWVEVRAELGARDGHGEKRLSRDYEAACRERVQEQRDRLVAAEQRQKALDNAARNLRQQLSAVQSAAAALRDEMRLAGAA